MSEKNGYLQMKNEKRYIVLVLFIILNIIIGNAVAVAAQNNTLQWFPAITADNNTVYIVWADERNGNYTRIMNDQPHKAGDIYITKGSFLNEWIFNENIRLNEIKGSTGHGSPSIAVDNNNLYIVWEDDRFGFEELYFSKSPEDVIRFKKDIPVAEDAASQVLPSIAVLNGTVYVAAMNKRKWDIDFLEGISVNGNYRFSKAVRVNDDPTGNWHYAPSLAVDDENNVCIAWLDARNGNYDIYISHGIKENNKWQFGRNFRVNDDFDNASQYTPSIASENGNIYIAWYDDRNKDFDIYFSKGRLENNELRFEKNIKVNDDSGNASQMHPFIAAAGGEIFLVWEDERENVSNIYFSKRTVEGDNITFDKNIRVNSFIGNHYDPQMEISQGNIYVVWQAEVTDGGDIYFSHGKYSDKNVKFDRSIKVNDDLTNSFVRPYRIFLGTVVGTVIVSIIIVAILRRKNE